MALSSAPFSSHRLAFVLRCCASAGRRVATRANGSSSSSGGGGGSARAATPYQFREDGHPLTAHAGVTAEYALGVAHTIIQSCRSQAVLTTHGEPATDGSPGAGLTTRVVGVRFDAKDERTGHADLRRLTLTTNPQTRKAAQLLANGGLSLCFFDTLTEGYLVLYARAAIVEDRQAAWDDRFPTAPMSQRAEDMFPGGATGGNFAAFKIDVERIEMINHDVSEETGQRGTSVIADHPIGWRPLVLVRAEHARRETRNGPALEQQDCTNESRAVAAEAAEAFATAVATSTSGWVLAEDDGRVIIL
jgi:general stress protein 26